MSQCRADPLSVENNFGSRFYIVNSFGRARNQLVTHPPPHSLYPVQCVYRVRSDRRWSPRKSRELWCNDRWLIKYSTKNLPTVYQCEYKEEYSPPLKPTSEVTRERLNGIVTWKCYLHKLILLFNACPSTAGSGCDYFVDE